MEIERKFLIYHLPENIEDYPHHELAQGYISTSPVIRIRKQDDSYILTIKSGGLIKREEFELNLSKEQFLSLSQKVDGTVIEKTRYLIPCPDYDELTIELDVFHGAFSGLIYAEVEFPNEESCQKFNPPAFFSREVTNIAIYQNSSLSRMSKEEITSFMNSYRLKF